MRNYLIIVVAIFSIACTKIKNENSVNIKTNISNSNNPFKEIGNPLLPSTKFDEKWYVQIYNEAQPMSENDSLNQKKLNALNFFDSIVGKEIKNNQYKQNLIDKNTAKIDSIFLIDSAIFGNKRLFYIKSYKTMSGEGYDFPPTEKNIDLLVYENKVLFKKINIYSDANYPFAKKLTIGYLNKMGILYTKYFDIDEEGVVFSNEKQEDLRKVLK